MEFPTPDNLGVPQAAENPSQGQNVQSAESAAPNVGNQQTPSQQQAQALADLDKMERFKFEGQEWSREDFRKAYLRQQDYSKKTAALAKDRETFASDQKYYENLYSDLDIVRNNPHLASEFIKLYPQKFHSYLKNVLSETRQTSNEQQAQKPQYDVETQSRVQKLESFVHEQEVAKNTQMINNFTETFSKKYPDAFAELAIANVYEAYNQGEPITEELFEKSFKEVNDVVQSRFKAKYSDLVKKQTTANKKGQDVESGGGTPGQAPQKFKSIDDVTKFAISSLGKR